MRRFFIVVGVTVLFVMLFVFSSFFTYDEIQVQLTVSDIVGFNVDTDALYLGSAPPGSSADRSIHIKNDRFLFGRVNIKVFGDVAPWLYASDNNFYLWRDEIKDVNIRVTVPKEVPYKDYNGTLRVYFFLV